MCFFSKHKKFGEGFLSLFPSQISIILDISPNSISPGKFGMISFFLVLLLLNNIYLLYCTVLQCTVRTLCSFFPSHFNPSYYVIITPHFNKIIFVHPEFYNIFSRRCIRIGDYRQTLLTNALTFLKPMQ